MDVKKAVETAKNYVGELFAEEGVVNLGLEEVVRDDTQDEWRVTLGFSRPWDSPPAGLAAWTQASLQRPRSYKIVRVSDRTGDVISVTNR